LIAFFFFLASAAADRQLAIALRPRLEILQNVSANAAAIRFQALA
jgi:hypothetical protein